ncbi:MAG: VCBS repeat-containing protein [Planctomycetes bacterium]|nr:VCBS repeat-containing protein [Planctomycetota bacterium]
MMAKPTFVLLFCGITALPGQTLQFEADGNRPAAAFLPGAFEHYGAADFDRDGDVDVAAIVLQPYVRQYQLSLHRRAGSGWQSTVAYAFPLATTFAVDHEVTIADLDGDSHLDVLVTAAIHAQPTGLFCFRNDGVGNFTLQTSTSMPGNRTQIATSDVDGDGDPDLVGASVDTAGLPQTLAVLGNQGNFQFVAVPGAGGNTTVRGFALADVDGDGDPDAAAVGATGEVLLLTNTGGTFAAAAIANGPMQHVLAADFDGDGDADVLAQAADGAVDLLRQESGGFVASSVTPGGASTTDRPVGGDWNGDGVADAAIAIDGQLLALRNDGQGGFTTESILAGRMPQAVDIDGDGRDDLLSQYGSGLSLALGHADRMAIDNAFADLRYAALADVGTTQDASDLDRDGRIDWIKTLDGTVVIHRNLAPMQWSSVRLPTAYGYPAVRAADVDGDGDDDLIVVDASTGLHVLRHDPGFAFVSVPQAGVAVSDLAGIGDFDGNGRADVLVTAADGSLQLLRSQPGGVFAPPTFVATGASRPAISDWDGDGDLDLIVGNAISPCGTLLVNDGSGAFALGNECFARTLNGYRLARLVTVDLDGDGDAELFSYGYGGGISLLNTGNGLVPGQIVSLATGSPLMKPLFADWDDDGDIDLLHAGSDAELWLNAGNGRLDHVTTTRIGSRSVLAAIAADLDGDGDPDPLGTTGVNANQRINHLRSATTLERPTPGAQMRVRLAHEPGFATGSTACIPLVALAPRAVPLAIPGFRGKWQLDIQTTVALPLLVLGAPAGIGEVTLPVPNVADLLGLDVYLQGLLLANVPAFTPAVHERVQR